MMRSSHRPISVAFQVLLAILSVSCRSPAISESCTGIYSNNPVGSERIAALGQVIEVDAGDDEDPRLRMKILERFTGLSDHVTVVDAYISRFYCSDTLKIGDTRLLVAWHLPKQDHPEDVLPVHVESCDFIQLADKRTRMLESLRSRPRGHSPIIAGLVQDGRFAFPDGRWSEWNIRLLAPLPGVTVTATQGDLTLRSVADENGEFLFHVPQQGQWVLDIESEYAALASPYLWQVTADTRAGCVYEELVASENGRISGHVRDEEGHPLAGVMIDASPSSSHLAGPVSTSRSAADGSYQLRGINPGEYLVEINPIRHREYNPIPPSFYPAASTPKNAKRLVLSSNEELRGIDIVAPHPRATHTLTLQVALPNGLAPSKFALELSDSSGRKITRYIQADHVDIPVYEGLTYSLSVLSYDGDSNLGAANASIYQTHIDKIPGETQSLKLVLQPSRATGN